MKQKSSTDWVVLVVVFLLVLVVLATPAPAFAQVDPVDLSCTLPTHNTDGTLLTDLKGIRFYESTVSGGPYFLIKENNPPVCAYVFERTDGTYYYVATAFSEPRLQNDGTMAETESVFSGEAAVTVGAPLTAPLPPTDLVVVEGDQEVFMLQKVTNKLVLVAVGTVPANTPCDGTQNILDHYVVPYTEVTPYTPGQTISKVIVAACL